MEDKKNYIHQVIFWKLTMHSILWRQLSSKWNHCWNLKHICYRVQNISLYIKSQKQGCINNKSNYRSNFFICYHQNTNYNKRFLKILPLSFLCTRMKPSLFDREEETNRTQVAKTPLKTYSFFRGKLKYHSFFCNTQKFSHSPRLVLHVAPQF